MEVGFIWRNPCFIPFHLIWSHSVAVRSVASLLLQFTESYLFFFFILHSSPAAVSRVYALERAKQIIQNIYCKITFFGRKTWKMSHSCLAATSDITLISTAPQPATGPPGRTVAFASPNAILIPNAIVI